MNEEIRKYLRKLSKEDSNRLKNKAKTRIKNRRNGFLTKDHVEKLSGITKFERGAHEGELSKYFFEIREKSHSALIDFQILCDSLTEEQLEEIFTKRTETKFSGKSFVHTRYSITELMDSLIPFVIYPPQLTEKELKIIRTEHPNFQISEPLPDKQIETIQKEREWRKYFLEDMAIQILLWYFHSGLFKTNSQKQLLFDAIDTIQVNSSGEKSFDLYHKLGRDMSIVHF